MEPGIFDALKQKLTENITSYPHVYMFKFIVKADNKTLALVEVLFEDDAEITQKESAKGNYLSITAKQVVMSVDEIIAIYEKAAKIEGVITM